MVGESPSRSSIHARIARGCGSGYRISPPSHAAQTLKDRELSQEPNDAISRVRKFGRNSCSGATAEIWTRGRQLDVRSLPRRHFRHPVKPALRVTAAAHAMAQKHEDAIDLQCYLDCRRSDSKPVRVGSSRRLHYSRFRQLLVCSFSAPMRNCSVSGKESEGFWAAT